MFRKNIFFLCCAFVFSLFFNFFYLFTGIVTAQIIDKDKEKFYFDAVIFNSEKPDSARVDIFCVVPNETLNFTNFKDFFSASYQINLTVTDSTNKIITSNKIKKTITTKDFLESQGANAEFSKVQSQIYLPRGNYKIRLVLTDLFSNSEYEKNRGLSVINFNDYGFSISGILLLSSIEEKNNKFIITPHISDNIGTLQNGYFTFFEVYNNSQDNKQVSIISEISDSDSKEIIYSNTIDKQINFGTNQVYIRIPNNINYSRKSNILRIFITNQEDISQVIAAAQRSIKSQSYLSDKIISNIDEAIRQLRYVALEDEVKYISSAPDASQKQKRFEEFWKNLDPTPQTTRNEAFEEYYFRIDYANKNFKSYSEGWLTDKGHVYIVFGSPNTIDKNTSSYFNSKNYEKWTYYNNRVFLFYDATGFGDFRLSNPAFISEKYIYEP